MVVDASAILALINNEKGSDLVEKMLPNALMSAVNFSEVITVASRNDLDENKVIDLLSDIIPNIIDFDYKQACIASGFDKVTKRFGLSLGDRACIALAKYKNCAVLTADKIWQKLDLDIEVKIIRE